MILCLKIYSQFTKQYCVHGHYQNNLLELAPRNSVQLGCVLLTSKDLISTIKSLNSWLHMCNRRKSQFGEKFIASCNLCFVNSPKKSLIYTLNYGLDNAVLWRMKEVRLLVNRIEQSYWWRLWRQSLLIIFQWISSSTLFWRAQP